MKNAARTLCALSLMALLAPLPLLAADLSDEELLNLFLMQRDAFRAAQSGETSGTRGLTLVTLDNIDVVTETATLGAPGTADTTAASAGGDTAIAASGAPDDLAAPEGDTLAVATDPAKPPATDSTEGTVVANVDQETVPTTVAVGSFVAEMQVNVRIEFDLDSAALNAAQLPKLDQLCRVMNAADIQHFRIIGHTDASGSDAYNQNLSQLRAQEVQRYFINKCGIDANRLEAVGVGEKLIPEGTDPNAPENRRVEFQALA